MFEKLGIIKMAQAMAMHASARQGLISQNIANANVPGYQTHDLPPFTDSYDAAGGNMRQTRMGHMMASGDGLTNAVERPIKGAQSPNGNNVSLESEMIAATMARQQHDLALAIYRSSTTILRTGLGRGK